MNNFELKEIELKNFVSKEDIDLEKYCFFIAPKNEELLPNFYALANKQSFANTFIYLSNTENNLHFLKKYFDINGELEIYFITNNSQNPIFYGTIETYLKIKK